MPAPTPADTADIRKPGLATRPTSCCKRTSDRSDTEPNPTAHTKPMSNPNPAPIPIVRCDTAPNPGLLPEPTPDRNPARSPSVRRHQDLLIRCSSGWCFARTERRKSTGFVQLFHESQLVIRRRRDNLYCVSSLVPRTIAIWPFSIRVLPCGVAISADPLRTITWVSPSPLISIR